MLEPAFGFGRRGGSKKNLVGMSESIHDARFSGVIRRHLHSYSIANCEANKSLAHFPGDVRENQVIVRKRNAKHGSGKDRHDRALDGDRFL